MTQLDEEQTVLVVSKDDSAGSTLAEESDYSGKIIPYELRKSVAFRFCACVLVPSFTLCLLLWLSSAALCTSEPKIIPRAPVGEMWDLLPDPDLEIPKWTAPYTGPDIPLNFNAQDGTNYPEQVALFPAVRNGSYIFVRWLLPLEEAKEIIGRVLYGKDRVNLKLSAECSSKTYSYAVGFPAEYSSGPIFQCLLGPLEPRTRYFYQIRGSPTVFNFTSMPKPGPQKYSFGLIADVGQTVNSSVTYDHVSESPIDFIIFAGDLSYADNYHASDCSPYKGPGTDLGFKTCGIGGVRWDSSARMAQKTLSQFPGAYTVGNHENELMPWWGERDPFKAYLARTPGLLDDNDLFPSASSRNRQWPAHSPLYYSLDIGPAHIIALSSHSGFAAYTNQNYFLKDDLCNIDREVTPWLIVFMHVPLYNSDVAHYLEGEPMRVAFEKYLYEANADIVLAGHVHAYERSHRVFNMRLDECGPIYATIGDGGNDEGVAGP
eukprot:TRINITY_DN1847_c0_g2_i1.p1 TRINITY_DN1847_c0_g2~~TRINITY_DN1847_c0_g2_i1.p1  ORF type:complete len:489 (+),score=56.61 TRINITY_DN1847_c0_g2_i1:613-2079(+)